MKKYIIYPEFIESKNDKETHFIDAKQLMSLYDVKEEECIIYNEENEQTVKSYLIQLFPLKNGNYKECLKYLIEEYNKNMCNSCDWCKRLKDQKIECLLHDEEYKDEKQVIFCSAKGQVEK
jgi:superfamily II DNA helicase RecQ